MRILISLFLLAANCSYGQELRYAYFDFPPLIYSDKNNKAQGMATNLIAQIEALTRYKFKPLHFPYKRILPALANGKADVFVTTKDDRLLALGRYSSNPIFTIRVVLITLPSRTLSQARNLAGILGVMRGFHFSGHLKKLASANPDLQVDYRNSHLSLLRSLQAKRIDYALDYLLPAQQAAQKIDLHRPEYLTIDASPMYIFVAKKLHGAERILEEINAVLPKLTHDEPAPSSDQEVQL